MTENSPAYGEILDAMKPIFITCASGNNAFTDVMLNKHHDGLRMNGHAEMVFNRAESAALALAVLKMIPGGLENDRGDAMNPGDARYIHQRDPIVESVRELLLQRSLRGIAKYGCDMTRTDLELIEWHQHRLEELLDSAVYTMRIIQQMRLEIDDGK